MNTDEIIDRIIAYHNNDMVHQLTCGNDSNHTPLIPIQQGDKVILICVDCNYKQSHIPKIVLDFKGCREGLCGRSASIFSCGLKRTRWI